MNTISSAGQNEEEIIGVNFPMPFGMKPLNVKLGQNRHLATRMGNLKRRPETKEQKLATSENMPEMDRRSQEALKYARIACLQNDQSACDQALERYHQTRYNESPMIKLKKIRAKINENPETALTDSLLRWLMPNLKTLY